MALFNNVTVVKRYNRPGILGKTLLEMFFTNNGEYFTPNTISAVFILPDTSLTNGSPDIYINRTASDIGTPRYGMLNATGLSAVVARFDVSNNIADPGVVMAVSQYDPHDTTGTTNNIFSGYENTVGDFQVVADGAFLEFSGFSAVGNYFDAWLVRDFVGGGATDGWQIYWNLFSEYSDRIVTFTEKFQVTTKNSLVQRYLALSSVVNLAIETDVFLANENMTQDLKNIWRKSVISSDSAYVRITKRNAQTTGERSVEVDWTNVGVDVNSANTIMYRFDTTEMEKGDYTVQVKYTLLDQTFVSEEFSLVLR